MRFYELRDNILKLINVRLRLQTVMLWYLIALMVETRKHSLSFASDISGTGIPSFSRFLKNNDRVAKYTLAELSKKQARKYSEMLKKSESLPWDIFIMIDDTMLNRSSLKSENVQRFNHGKGYVIGHQWTNIIIFFNGMIIPMPPIPFYTKKYCKDNKTEYKSSHDRLTEYLNGLNLYEYIGSHDSSRVAVLTDSGFDDKKIQNAVLKRGWNFISALKSSRGLKSEAKYAKTGKSSGWDGCADFFIKNRIIAWITVSISADGPKKRRKDFRIRHAGVFLKGVGKITAVCSEFRKKRGGRRKYIACSDLKATPSQILTAYGFRWKIEIFHKHVKMHFGFGHIAAKHFSSVISHVHLVYCAYILMQTGLPGISDACGTLFEKQEKVAGIMENRKIACTIHELTKIGGAKRLKDQLKSVLEA